MKFLVDESSGFAIYKWLLNQGYDVIFARDIFQGAPDETVLKKAFEESRILITDDRDFGELIFLHKKPHAGLIYLRLSIKNPVYRTHILKNILDNHKADIPGNCIIAKESRIQIIKIKKE